MDRRNFLLAAPTVLIGSSLPLRLAADGHAAAPAILPGVIRRTVGDMSVTALSDGFLTIGHEVLQGIEKDDFDAMVSAAYGDPGNNLAAVNAYYIETGELKILVDIGTGTAFGPTLGQLPANLAAAGIDTSAVTHLLVTHLHPDHVGGLVGETSVALPNAEMVVGTQDHSFFTSEEMKAQAPDGFKPFFDMAVAAAGQFGERVTLIDGEASIAPGITAMPLPGHTPGHMGFMLESGGEQLLIWGDILHVPAVQFARPDVTLAFDADPDTARASRTKVLDMVATDKLMVAGMHMSFPGLGYVERASEGYRLVPAPWDYT